MRLHLNDLWVGHRAHCPLLEGVTACFEPGGMHVLLGVNGAGKTTLLRTLLGVQTPLSGHFFIKSGSEVIHPIDGKAWGRHVAFVPSMPPKHVGLTVSELLSLSGSSSEALSSHPQLKSWRNQRMSMLSDGQAQQVMVARAMLQSRHWLVLDEPTAFLDVRSQRHLWSMLTTHLKKGGSAMLATHDLRGVHRWFDQAPQGVVEASSIHIVTQSGLQPISASASLDDLESALV